MLEAEKEGDGKDQIQSEAAEEDDSSDDNEIGSDMKNSPEH